ncbi:hypothetical protein X743_27005 [Mesorhizobium sp. LNHC252B00]|nr:hypothetical protein X743_27005 [Mesorhizobium sp. LNHC252B00]
MRRSPKRACSIFESLRAGQLIEPVTKPLAELLSHGSISDHG